MQPALLTAEHREYLRGFKVAGHEPAVGDWVLDTQRGFVGQVKEVGDGPDTVVGTPDYLYADLCCTFDGNTETGAVKVRCPIRDLAPVSPDMEFHDVTLRFDQEDDWMVLAGLRVVGRDGVLVRGASEPGQAAANAWFMAGGGETWSRSTGGEAVVEPSRHALEDMGLEAPSPAP